MRRLGFIAALVFTGVAFTPGPAHARKEGQAMIDSIEQSLASRKQDTGLVNSLCAISFNFSTIDPATGLRFGQQALDLATRLGWERGIASSYSRLGVNNLYLNHFDKALEYNRKGLAIYEKEKYEHGISAASVNIGMVYLNQSDFANARTWFQKALDIDERTGDKNGVALDATNMAIICAYQCDYTKALELNFKALAIQESAGDNLHAANSAMNIGSCYHSLAMYGKARQFFLRALKMEEDAGNKNGIASAYLNLGANAGDSKDYSHALEYGLKALNMFTGLRDTNSLAIVNSNIGNYYQFLGDQQRAISYSLQAVQLAREINSPMTEAWSLSSIGQSYLLMDSGGTRSTGDRHGLLQKAIDYSQQAKELGLKLHIMDLVSLTYETLSDAYRRTGNLKLALDCANNHHAIRDSLFSEEKKSQIDSVAFSYELDKKQSRIALLEKDKLLDAAHIRQQLWQRNSIVVSALLLTGLIVALMLARMQRNTRRMSVAFSRSLIQSQEDERRRISRELHDSIGQNILFVSNHLSARADPDLQPAMQIIASTIDEVRNISKDLYPNQLEKYGLVAAITALAEKASQATGVFISADLHEVEHLIPGEAAISIYRIIQESLSNAIRHSGATAIRITGTLSGKNMVLSIMDNGKGFDTSLLQQKAQRSFGMLNMEERASMLGGSFQITSSTAGTHVSVTIPIS